MPAVSIVTPTPCEAATCSQVLPTLATIGVTTVLSMSTAFAAVPAVSVPDSTDFSQNTATGPFDFIDTIGRSNYLLGNMWGLRTWLSRFGGSLGFEETSEVLGNVTGGSKRGMAYDGLTQAVLQVDSQRACGIKGGTFNVSALQIHGRNLSAENLDTLQTASGIEADRSTRLWELWYQQKFLDENRLDLKVGQQSLDQEFIGSQNASYFVNTMFGWPMLPSDDLPGGGPAYPLSDLGVRLRARPTDAVTVLAGVFNGSPSPSSDGDPQKQDRSGTSFRVNGGTLFIAELQFAYPSLGTMVKADQSDPLACLYKIGFWYDSERFSDQRYDDNGVSLADPTSDGTPRNHRGDYSIYVVGDQMIWHDPADSDRNINVFIRAMDAPQSDRNLISFSLNFGLTFHEPFLHRDDDTAGIGMGYARVGNQDRGLDEDVGTLNGTNYPVRSGETFFEATYQYQMTPWCQIQPDVQYVINPGGGLPNPDGSGTKIRNELVLGLRTNVLF